MKYSLLLILIFGFLFLQNSYAQTSVANDSDSIMTEGRIYKIPGSEASFPGGLIARNKYFKKFLDDNIKAIIADKSQFCYLKFVVDKKGSISEVTTNVKVETILAKVLIEALKTGPKWVPASKNGAKVNAYADLTFIFEPKKTGRSAFPKNSIKYYITRENEVEKHFQKILILVAGTVPARIFTDHLYENLKTDLENKAIQTEYLFLGNERRTALEKFNNITRSLNFDAILLFIQEDGAIIKEMNYNSDISVRSVSLKQSMNIYLLEPGDFDTPIMEAKVFMNFNLLKKSAYPKASKDFLSLLQQNRISNKGD